MQRYLLTGIGGFLGAVARLWVGTAVTDRLGARFPYGTFAINLSGCLVIGLVLTVLNTRVHLSPGWRYLFPIGFVGAYTTFSSFEYETLATLQAGHVITALLYVGLSVILGFAFVCLGVALGRMIA